MKPTKFNNVSTENLDVLRTDLVEGDVDEESRGSVDHKLWPGGLFVEEMDEFSGGSGGKNWTRLFEGRWAWFH